MSPKKPRRNRWNNFNAWDDDADDADNAYDEYDDSAELKYMDLNNPVYDTLSSSRQMKEPSPDAILIKGPIMATSQGNKFGQTWWGKRWIDVLLELTGDKRLDRGRTYARNGSILELSLSTGQAFAHVQGSMPYPYYTYVYLDAFTEQEWHTVLEIFSSQAIFLAKLLAGEMPAEIDTVLQSAGVSLFPRSLDDISFDCSCMDYIDPCKHAAAIYYLLAEQIDQDPFLLFHLRGQSRPTLLDNLQRLRSGESTANAPKPLSAQPADFWGNVDLLPGLERPSIMREGSPTLHQYGAPPVLSLKLLDQLYQYVGAKAFLDLHRDTDKPSSHDQPTGRAKDIG